MITLFGPVNLMYLVGYIDPGSGQLLWQVLIAAGVGVLFYLKKSRDFLSGLAKRLFKKD
jgi:hypothetical protein